MPIEIPESLEEAFLKLRRDFEAAQDSRVKWREHEAQAKKMYGYKEPSPREVWALWFRQVERRNRVATFIFLAFMAGLLIGHGL